MDFLLGVLVGGVICLAVGYWDGYRDGRKKERQNRAILIQQLPPEK
jgi:hypothetical protein